MQRQVKFSPMKRLTTNDSAFAKATALRRDSADRERRTTNDKRRKAKGRSWKDWECQVPAHFALCVPKFTSWMMRDNGQSALQQITSTGQRSLSKMI